ncbi:glycosyltransferase family 39 protein [Methanobacterium sp.]|uniref:glycosyltransferase family 39 protein n=1 Tax=Methanobacterium sp. TaxID=2164 RepID=UPI002ABD0F18|nr:glycosyltransferase family 39 protein [Methanobacterium sp.]MDY9922723.1 glycosyltransferase family 39 protein [Methanobacterium sp.]
MIGIPKTFSRKIKSHSSTLFFLLVLTLIVSFITYNCFLIQTSIGPVWDTYDFMANAALMAGKGIGYFDLLRPPLLSFLTAIYYSFDGLALWPIAAIDGIIFVAGVIGLYLLFKLRFDALTSFLGALIFATFPIVLTYVGAGFTDNPSVCVSIWALLFTALAVKKDSRLFYLSFPLVMLAFLTRFSMALLIFPVFLYLFINWGKIKSSNYIRDIVIGIIISLLLLIPVFMFYSNFGNPIYPFLDFFGSSSGASSAGGMHFAYNTDFLYYVELLPSLIGPEGIGVLLVILLGVVAYIFRRFREKKEKTDDENVKTSFQQLLENNGKLKLLSIIIVSIILILTIEKVHYLISESLFFIWCYLLYDWIKILKYKDIDLDFLFLSWLVTFFLFHSIYIIKDYRYFVSMAPTTVYFMMRGFNWTTSQFGFKLKNHNLTQIVFALVLTLLVVFSALSSFSGIQDANKELKAMNEESVAISDWFMQYDPDYKNKVIYTDFWPYSGWYLQMNVSKMPIFRDGEILYCGAKNYNFTQQDITAYNNELDSYNADYYFSMRRGLNFTNYHPIKQIGLLILYQRNE